MSEAPDDIEARILGQTLATTKQDIEQAMSQAVDEHGEQSFRTLDVAESLADDFDDIEYLGSHGGEEARWGSRDHHVYRLPDGSLVGVQWYNGATESQDSFYEGRVVDLEERTVTTYVERGR